MYKRYNSVYSVIDTEQDQHNYPLPLWGLTAVELWEKNIGNKYGKIEFYRFVNHFPIDEFKTKFYNQFGIYKTLYPEGTVETFKKKEYQQFAYECEDMIELIEKKDWIYWTTEREFDFYIQGKGYNKKVYVLGKDDHTHEINLKALLQFLKIDCINGHQDKDNDFRTNAFEEYTKIGKSDNNKIIKPELTIKQIALKYAYENKLITRENQNAIALDHNHNTGGKLYQDFLFYFDRNNRKAKPHPSYTRKTLNNKIKLFESVIELLSIEEKKKAKDELTILKGFLLDFE